MKWLRFILKTMMTSRRRTVLTMAAVTLALFIYIVLETVMQALTVQAESGQSNEVRLAVLDRSGDPHKELPGHYAQRLARCRNVTAVTPVSFTPLSPGVEQGKVFLAYAIIPEMYGRIFESEFRNLAPSEYATFRATRNGAIVGREIIERMGWQVGEIVELESLMNKLRLTLTICGVYSNHNGSNQQLESQILIHYDYYDECKGNPATANFFWLRVDAAANKFRAINAVQQAFEDAEQEIGVETEGAMQSKVNQLTATIRMILGVIATMVLGTVLVVIANSIALTVRERRREFAVMKTLGYTPANVMWLVFGESVLTTLFAGAIGTLAAFALFALGRFSVTMILTFNFAVSPETVLKGLLVSFAIGAVSGLIPAFLAGRVRVIETLRSL